MPSYKLVVNFVKDIATTVTVTVVDMVKNVDLGIFVNGVLLEKARTDGTTGDYSQTFTVPDNMKKFLLNHSMFTMNSPSISTTGAIGNCTVDSAKIELRYV